MDSLRRARGPLSKPMPLMSALLLALPIALASSPCQASLGRAPSDFGNAGARQAQSLAAAKAASPAAASPGAGSPGAWNVNVSVLDNGTTVREYVANGVVFAVSWNGPFLPNLRDLLGSHFDTLTAETARHPKAGSGQVRIQRSDVTIESGGHMRAYEGRAWVNSLLPAGFNTGDIE
jgi:hypothetical protein